MNAILKTALAVAGMAVAAQAAAQITFYEREGFAGRSFTAEKEIRNFERYGFNDRASSVVVLGDRCEVCEDARFGGILGHQVGNGRGNDLATVGGAVAGAAVGANIGRASGGQQVATQDVQRCESVPSQARSDLWDVTYIFRGQEHRIQLTAPPGSTISVNERGEPRA